MEAPQAAKPNPSRTAVIVVVVVLIVIAIAGIVLAGRRTAQPSPGSAAAVPAVPAATTPQADAGPTSGPNEVVFAAGSDKMLPQAAESVVKFSEAARNVGGQIRLSVRFLTGANKAQDMELAKKRTAAVRHALEANGIKAETMQVELVEMPAGGLTAKDADRVELSMR